MVRGLVSSLGKVRARVSAEAGIALPFALVTMLATGTLASSAIAYSSWNYGSAKRSDADLQSVYSATRSATPSGTRRRTCSRSWRGGNVTVANSTKFQGAVYAVNDYSEENSTVWGPVIARRVSFANSSINHYVPIGTLMPGMPATYEDVVTITNEPGSWG